MEKPGIGSVALAHPAHGAGTAPGGAVFGVGQATILQRQATASDTEGQAVTQAFQFGNVLVDTLLPGGGKSRPVGLFRYAVIRQLFKLGADFVEGKADFLGEHDEGDTADGRARETAMPGIGAQRMDQAAFLVETQRGSGHPAALRELADGDFVSGRLVHVEIEAGGRLDFKFT